MPPYVYKRRGCYVLGEYNPDSKRVTCTRLCSDKADIAEIWSAYNARKEKTQFTFEWLSDLYQASEQFKSRSAKTQREYKAGHRRICDTKIKGGKLGDAPLSAWSPASVRRYMDTRPKVAANREKAYISLVFSWGYARGHVKTNPAKGVPRNTEKSRTRYVTDTEYDNIYKTAPAHVQCVMELAYMMRARLAEVLDLTRDSITDDGVLLHRRKGSKDALVLWTPRLRAAIDAAKKLPRPNDFNRHLFQSRDGERMRESTIQSAWQRMKVGFTIHDLKAKGVTDFTGDKVQAGGWKDPKMVNTYDRAVNKVEPTE